MYPNGHPTVGGVVGGGHQGSDLGGQGSVSESETIEHMVEGWVAVRKP